MIFLRPEVVRQILRMYMTGVPIEGISEFLGVEVEIVNKILDSYAPSL